MRTWISRPIRIEIEIKRRRLLFVAVLLGVGALAGRLEPETLTSTTVYPSPGGVYTTVLTANQAVFARETGGVVVGSPAHATARLLVGGKVGIGTGAPASPLDVNGNAQVAGNATVAGSFVIPTGAQANYVLTAQNAAGTAAWAPASGGGGGSGNLYLGSCQVPIGSSCKCNKGEKIMLLDGPGDVFCNGIRLFIAPASQVWSISGQGTAAVTGNCSTAGGAFLCCSFSCFK